MKEKKNIVAVEGSFKYYDEVPALVVEGSGAYRCFIPFPFCVSDTNYTVVLNGVSQANVGDVLASASVETKYRTGFELIVSGAYDYSKCGIAVNYTVTLN